jgi:hypothetical protein
MMVRRSSLAYGSGSTGLSLVPDSGPPTDNLRVHPRVQVCAGAEGVPVGQRLLFVGGAIQEGAGASRPPRVAISNNYTWSLQAAPVTGPSTVFLTSPAVSFSMKDTSDGLPSKALRYYVRPDLVPSSMVYRLLLGHECVPAGANRVKISVTVVDN